MLLITLPQYYYLFKIKIKVMKNIIKHPLTMIIIGGAIMAAGLTGGLFLVLVGAIDLIGRD